MLELFQRLEKGNSREKFVQLYKTCKDKTSTYAQIKKQLLLDTFMDGKKFILKASEFKEATGLSEGLTIKSTQGITIVVTIIAVSIMFWFLNKTKSGTSMRAYSDNEDLALLSGIDPKKVVMTTEKV